MSSAAERAYLIREATRQAYQQLDVLNANNLMELGRLYQAVAESLRQQLATYGEDGYFAAKYLKPFLGYLDALLVDVAKTREVMLDQALAGAAGVGANPAVLMGAVGVDLAVAHSVKAVMELELADGLQLSDRLWRIDRGAKQAIAAAVKQAIAQGSNPMSAARALLNSGQGLPADLAAKIGVLQVGNLQNSVSDVLLTGRGNALYNVQRVFQTETTRAHGLAYVKSNEGVRGLVGYKFKLSPMHKRTDICDRLAAADNYGLGRGIYPADKIMGVFPAHPNTRSTIVAVYRD